MNGLILGVVFMFVFLLALLRSSRNDNKVKNFAYDCAIEEKENCKILLKDLEMQTAMQLTYDEVEIEGTLLDYKSLLYKRTDND